MEKEATNVIDFHPHSFGDDKLRLFQLNGQIYRGISAEKSAFFTKLFQDGVIKELTEKGLLIESELASLSIEPYRLIVHHRCIPFASYPNEWCAAMFKNAALTLINLAIELAQSGCTLIDAHPWNLLFDIDRFKPVFVDLGSVIPISTPVWLAYEEFCRFCLYPLILMCHGYDKIARLLMCEDEGVSEEFLLKLTGDLLIFKLSNIFLYQRLQRLSSSYFWRVQKKISSIKFFSSQFSVKELDLLLPYNTALQRKHLKFLENIRQGVESISLPAAKGERSELCGKPDLSISSQVDWTVKQQSVHKVIAELRPSSVLDIGCGTGWYSKLAAILGSKVVSLDTEQDCITQLYYDACTNKLPILPLVMDFTKPTPARGLADHWAIAATHRFQCDMVLALALVHHIVKQRHLNFEQIVEGLALFSKRWLLVEFVSCADREVSELELSKFSWYTLNNLLESLERKFDGVKQLTSYSEDRTLILCEK